MAVSMVVKGVLANKTVNYDTQAKVYVLIGWRGGGSNGRGCKRSSFCGTPEKKLQNLQHSASKVMIQRLRHHQDSQVAFYIDTKL